MAGTGPLAPLHHTRLAAMTAAAPHDCHEPNAVGNFWVPEPDLAFIAVVRCPNHR